MAKITDHDRHIYYEKIKGYMSAADALLRTEEKFLLEAGKYSPEEAALKKLVLVDEMLNLTSNYIAISGISYVVLKNKNEEALNDARKSIYKAVIYLEEIVSKNIDAPFSEYEDKLALITSFDTNQRYQLVRKMGLTVDLLEQAYGDNSKWRWSFVELEGRFAAAAKNIIDFRSAVENSDYDSPFYESSIYHFRLVKKLLTQSADRYREKYELSTGQVQDFRMGIDFLAALRRLHIVLNDREEAEDIKKKLNIWSAKLETDLKKQEEAKKKL
ncbi:MAG: hypothetical protein LBG91_01850 [Treponema sp.]|jgi:hypothetical protein|nr:hypothetical protein [Treponema sp.]